MPHTSVSRFLRCRAISNAARATRDEPVLVMTRTEIVISSVRRNFTGTGHYIAIRLKAFVILTDDDEVDIFRG